MRPCPAPFTKGLLFPKKLIYCSAAGDRAVTPRSSASHFTSGSEKLSAAKAEDRNPARVMAI